jgi:hypothetical protein
VLPESLAVTVTMELQGLKALLELLDLLDKDHLVVQVEQAPQVLQAL